ncbi:hypothetical protein GCM10025874_01880 [Arenivirga flava]|uniref:Uncharacterized protein n=1 Tax=Arenivirga flava TaxID=1930060 RepID=A0AA37UAP6_9MICO|nr:hypothetical protein GCM10025874_01880 [Arenivirga flava]
MVLEAGSGLRVEAGAVGAADRLERQREHDRVAHELLEVDLLLVDVEVELLLARIREELGHIDVEVLGDRAEAPPALADGGRAGAARDQHALVDAVETPVDRDRRALLDRDQRLAEARGCGELERELAALAGPADEVVDRDDVGGGGAGHPASLRAAHPPGAVARAGRTGLP